MVSFLCSFALEVSSIQKIQPNHLLVPRVSSNFAGDDTLSLFLEGDVPAGAGINERRCTYHASDSDAESITAQVIESPMGDFQSIFTKLDSVFRRLKPVCPPTLFSPVHVICSTATSWTLSIWWKLGQTRIKG